MRYQCFSRSTRCLRLAVGLISRVTHAARGATALRTMSVRPAEGECELASNPRTRTGETHDTLRLLTALPATAWGLVEAGLYAHVQGAHSALRAVHRRGLSTSTEALKTITSVPGRERRVHEVAPCGARVLAAARANGELARSATSRRRARGAARGVGP